jgi:hypothetical protein
MKNKISLINKYIKIIIYFFCVLLIYFYFMEFRKNFSYLPLTLPKFLSWLFMSIICNFGLFFITTKLRKQFKIISTILYLPTLLVSPMIVPNNNVIFFYFISILIFIKYFPWRKNDERSL